MKGGTMRRKIGCIMLVMGLLFLSSNSLYAQQKESSATNPGLLASLKEILDKIDFTSRISSEYDTNVFLEEDQEDADVKNTVFQGFSLQLPSDKTFFQLDYGINFDYYHQESKDLLTQDLKSVLSYRPFNKLALGISGGYKKVSKSSISTTLGDRIVSLGYDEITTGFEGKYELSDKTSIATTFDWYRLDIADSSRDDFIDRTQSLIGTSLRHMFVPTIEGYVGFGHQDVRFEQTAVKNSGYDRLYTGLVKKIPELCKLTAEVGWGKKDIETQRDDSNVDFSIIVNSLFSTYTKWSLLVDINKLEPSSRSEYSQYTRSLVSLQLEHFLTPKLQLVSSINYEHHRFDEEDSISSSFTENSKNKIYWLDLTLRRILNNWLTLDGGYTFTKRDTDFAAEGYTDHKIMVGLTATY